MWFFFHQGRYVIYRAICFCGTCRGCTCSDGTPQKELTEFSLPANNQVELEPSLCTPTSITSARKNRAGSLKTEGYSRIQKITKATRQQLELHNLRKRVVEEELLRAKEERDFMRKKAELELMKAKDEAELASLKLKEYKRKVTRFTKSIDRNENCPNLY